MSEALGLGYMKFEGLHLLGHASHQGALRYQHATRQRDQAIADALDHLISLGP